MNNELSVDGGDNSDDWIGGFLQNFSPDAIQEFAMRTAQEDADTGGTTAASVVITTKHGTNEWHGSGAFYGRAASLNARFPIDNPAPGPKQPFSRQNYVGTLGATSAHPLPVLVLGWHPWAVIRIVSFVTIGVVLSEPLLSWLGGFRVDWRTARRLLAWAAAGLIADVVLKWLLAPVWQRLLLRAVGW